MAKEIYRVNVNDPNASEQLKELVRKMLAEAPKHVRQLGRILRHKSTLRLKYFLRDHGYAGIIKDEDLSLFRDYLITKRLDLKDMEPEARFRLRNHTLLNQPADAMTDDYRHSLRVGPSAVTCKHCKWFVTAPPDEDKSCVTMGTKGDDFPCYGFTIEKVP